jgi:hypothetical protein
MTRVIGLIVLLGTLDDGCLRTTMRPTIMDQILMKFFAVLLKHPWLMRRAHCGEGYNSRLAFTQ